MNKKFIDMFVRIFFLQKFICDVIIIIMLTNGLSQFVMTKFMNDDDAILT